MYDIETGIEIPKSNKGQPPRYPWENMKIGDCITVPDKADGEAKRAVQAAYAYAKTHDDFNITVRSVFLGKGKTKPVKRIWRVE